MREDEPARAAIWVHGRVQGVGFRWWARARALELGLVGYARNTPDGRVEIVAQGPPDKVRELVRLLEEKPTSQRRPGDVTTCVTSWGPAREGLVDFLEK
ncbi:acylphosphatase [Pedococcus sp. 5OH_020]|jgi:acylphosphatase|uniref:acylphosphatase n=1 Tax=Pedococcus sp. 5OH_020 TaxID=2989814 RepID=UPI0022E9C9AE|nr:acylphosphatase [Pedococcus sp. 5OH_020]